jgi:NAD(P)H-flavin reductase
MATIDSVSTAAAVSRRPARTSPEPGEVPPPGSGRAQRKRGELRDPMMPAPYRIQKLRRELNDTFTVEMIPADGGKIHPFQPGQFNMLYVFGMGEVPISISGDPQNEDMLTHTVRAVGPVTEAMSRLKPGEMMGVRGPFGTAWPMAEAEGSDVIVLTGGIGLAPLRPAIYHLLNHRYDYGRICIYYGARTPEDILYRSELEKWRGQFDLSVDVTVDRATGRWAGKVGVVTRLVGRGGFDPYHTIAIVCGPEVMMRYGVKALAEAGVSDDRIYLSMERNMKCGVGFCGHCQFGHSIVCKDGPVFRYDHIDQIFDIREL